MKFSQGRSSLQRNGTLNSQNIRRLTGVIVEAAILYVHQILGDRQHRDVAGDLGQNHITEPNCSLAFATRALSDPEPVRHVLQAVDAPKGFCYF